MLSLLSHCMVVDYITDCTSSALVNKMLCSDDLLPFVGSNERCGEVL